MKSYKDYEKLYIGYSDIAGLVLRGCDRSAELDFGGDGEYYAYVVDADAEIGEHYHLAFECKNWLWIYDDEKRTFMAGNADVIKIYRAGDYGCVIQVVRGAE